VKIARQEQPSIETPDIVATGGIGRAGSAIFSPSMTMDDATGVQAVWCTPPCREVTEDSRLEQH
jgi:hypothetical protein